MKKFMLVVVLSRFCFFNTPVLNAAPPDFYFETTCAVCGFVCSSNPEYERSECRKHNKPDFKKNLEINDVLDTTSKQAYLMSIEEYISKHRQESVIALGSSLSNFASLEMEIFYATVRQHAQWHANFSFSNTEIKPDYEQIISVN